MHTMNLPALCISIIIIFIGILLQTLLNCPNSNAQDFNIINIDNSKKLHTNKAQNIKKIDFDFFQLMMFLEKQMPLTYDKLTEIGFKFVEKLSSDTTKYYDGTNVMTQDGILITYFDLRIVNTSNKKGTLFVINVAGEITKKDFERKMGYFMLYSTPRGASMKEKFGYIKHIGQNYIVAGYSQQNTEILLSVMFNAVVVGNKDHIE